MKSHSEIRKKLIDPGIIAIIRTDSSSYLLEIARALKEGGIRAMEITLTTPDALKTIEIIRKNYSEEIIIGVGTVLNQNACEEALSVGAEFVVTPTINVDVIKLCRQREIPILCGAYTPTEILTAWEAGTDFVKLFPADTLGPSYIKAIKAPLPQVEIIPTGGVDLHTIKDFIDAGCPAVAAGSKLLDKKVIQTQNWNEITRTARQFIETISKAKGLRVLKK